MTRQTRVLLLLAMLAAFALRVYRLDGPALRGDEAFSILLARHSPAEMLPMLTASTEPHPPFHFMLLHYWGRWAGESEFALRYTSAWFGVLAVPLIFLLGRLLWDTPAQGSRPASHVGLIAAWLVALNPFYIWHAQEARMYAILATTSIASTALFVLLRRRRGWVWPLGYGVVTALAVYTHYYAALVVLFQVCWTGIELLFRLGAGRRGLRDPALWRWLGGLSLSALLFLPWAPALRQILGAYHGSARSDLPLLAPLYRCLLVFGQGQTVDSDVALWFLPLWGGLFLVGVWAAWRRSRENAVLVLLSLLVPWAVIFYDSLQRPAFDERYFMVSTPAYYLLLALAFDALLGAKGRAAIAAPLGQRGAWIAGFCGLLVFGVSGFSLYNHYHNPAYARAPDWRALDGYYAAHTRPGDVVILNYPDPAATYYYDFAVPWVLLPAAFPVEEEAVGHELESLSETYERIWFTPQPWATWDAQGVVESWLDAHAERAFEGQVGSFRLLRYHTPRYVESEMIPLDARFGDQIRLLGVVLRDGEGNAVPRVSIRPGGSVRLTLYWEAEQAIAEDYVVFVHLLDPTGWLRGQQDNPPRGGSSPTHSWLPGERVIDPYTVSLASDVPHVQSPSPGGDGEAYLLEVGLYRPADGSRVPVFGADADPEQRRVLLQQRVLVDLTEVQDGTSDR